jgi:hypothetical protein
MTPKVVCVNLTLLDDDGYRGEEGDERIPDSGIETVLGARFVHCLLTVTSKISKFIKN